MQLLFVRIISIVVIALVYMLYDVFNDRNVPSIFGYLTLAYGFALTVLYLNLGTILISTGIALAVLGLGYLIYKAGQLGDADVIEFAALSLVLPLQQAPLLLSHLMQFNMPFIVSLVINTGVVALIILPLYYLPRAFAAAKGRLRQFITGKEIFLSVFAVVAYGAFILFLLFNFNLGIAGIVILSLVLVSSAFSMLFSKAMTYSMVKYIPAAKFQEKDMIAFNLMSGAQIKGIRKKIKDFDRLVTPRLIKELKKKRIKEKFPVYRKAMPYAVPMFIAVVFSVLLGNLVLLALGI